MLAKKDEKMKTKTNDVIDCGLWLCVFRTL